MDKEVILEVKNLRKYYPIHSGLFLRHTGNVKALENVSFSVKRGEILGIVGESGCGKSTLGKSIIRLHESDEGEVLFQNQNFFDLNEAELRYARREIQMIFQDPFASLDPRMSVANIIGEALLIHNIGTKKEREDRVRELMEVVGLDASYVDRYPHEFSGGQRQRISIARCLALKPQVIIADEPVSALDVSIQAQILNLLKDLQKQFDFTIIFISHDLSVIEHMCDNIVVMYLGNNIEKAPHDDLFSNPRHPYTQALINVIPVVGEGKKTKRKILSGDVGSPINPPSGCKFHPRCEFCMDKCRTDIPVLREINENHFVACWLDTH